MNEIFRNIRKKAGFVNSDKIRQQIADVAPLMNRGIDPRKSLHLDSTKIAYPQHRERLEAWLAGKKVAPITIDMALTQKCGFSCVYCYANLQSNPESPASWETYQFLLDDFVSIGHKPGEGVRAVSLVSDGESTENPHFRDFVLYGKYLGLDMAVGTNGYKFKPDPELVKAFTYIRFNISGAEREPYKEVMGVKNRQFDTVLDNIRKTVQVKRENGLDTTIGLQMVLLPEYADQVIPLALLGKEMGVDYLVIKHCSDDEKGSLGVDYQWYRSDLARELLVAAESLSTSDYSVQAKWSKLMTGRDRKYSKCFATPLMIQMSGSCLVAPCGPLFGEDYSRFHIGNYTRQRFRDIWASDKYWETIGKLHSDGFDPRKMCGTLCLQDKVNEALFDFKENGRPIPDMSDKPTPQHINFI